MAGLWASFVDRGVVCGCGELFGSVGSCLGIRGVICGHRVSFVDGGSCLGAWEAV